jgi:hypothetical protein
MMVEDGRHVGWRKSGNRQKVLVWLGVLKLETSMFVYFVFIVNHFF